MRNIVLLIVCITLTCPLIAQTKRALVIGIGQYPAESGWAKIHGDNDIDIICTFLLKNGFQKNNIITLQNEQATKNRIVESIKAIINSSKSNDFIYIHFSGHGQQITDLNNDEDDGYDEAWIPYDAEKYYKPVIYEGKNHLVDDEINLLLKELKRKIGKDGQIIVIVDACHSGDSSRGEEDEDSDEDIIRGTYDKFEIPNIRQSAVKKKNTIQWAIISACKSYQNNYECIINGKHYGSLSYSLYSQQSNLTNASLKTITEMLTKKMKEIIPNRSQTIEVDTPSFSSELILFKK